MNKERNSNIELLRIFAMLMIVFHHFNIHGVFGCVKDVSIDNINILISALFAIGGKIGVQLFLLISGFFMIKSGVRAQSLFRIYFQTLFYSLLFLICSFIYGSHHVSTHILNTSLFPFFGTAYWFISYYLALCIFSPIVNFAIYEIHKNPKKYLFPLLVFTILITNTFRCGYNVSELDSFLLFYSLGAFIRLKTFKIFENKKLLKMLALASLFIIFVFITVMIITHVKSLIRVERIVRLNSIFSLVISVYLFKIFCDFKPYYNKIINRISGSVFAVYLIHDNNIVRPFLWKKLLNVGSYITSGFFIFKMVFVCFAVFFVCVFVDKLFSYVYKPLFDYIFCRLKRLPFVK